MKLLRAWIESSNSLCVDLRTKLDFKQCHLKSSTNIPLSQLVLRQSELPPKRLPFAVIEPLHEKGCATWLIEQGWQVPWVLWEGELTWKQAIENGWISDTDEQWLLFQPSPFLMAHMDTIELPLRQFKKDTPWTCLDIGCGSGRDVGWLLARNKQWHASAFDSLAGAMVRTDLLVRNLNVSHQLDLLAQAKLLNNGEWKLVSDAWWDPHGETQELQDPTEEIAKRLAMTALESKDTASYMFPQFYNRLNPVAESHTFDLILNIRFLSRPFLAQVPSLLNKGGCFVISHFVDDPAYDYKQPKKSLRLQMNEISQFFAKFDELEIIKDVIEEIEDGRPINSVIVRKKE